MAKSKHKYLLTGIVAILLVLLIISLEGCTIDPKYVRPTTPTTAAYKEEPSASFKEAG